MVDLVLYTDANLQEVGYLQYAVGDFAIGTKNNFELSIPPSTVSRDSYLMLEDSEFGGIVDGVELDTTLDYDVVTGRTWQGILESNKVKPDQGQSHLILSGEANSLLQQLIDRLGLGFCMVASTENSGYAVSGFAVSRLGDSMGGYTVMRTMLASVGAKLRLSYSSALRRVVLSAVKQESYIDNGIDGDRHGVALSISRPCNHLHCMGSGTGASRITLDLYADDDGVVSKTQTLFGVKHKEEVYESPNSDAADLEEQGWKRLGDMQASRSCCSLVGENDNRYDIDDIVGAKIVKGDMTMSIVTTVAQKIATLDGKTIDISVKTALEA